MKLKVQCASVFLKVHPNFFRRRFGTLRGKRDTEPSPARGPRRCNWALADAQIGRPHGTPCRAPSIHLHTLSVCQRLALPSCCRSTPGLCTLIASWRQSSSEICSRSAPACPGCDQECDIPELPWPWCTSRNQESKVYHSAPEFKPPRPEMAGRAAAKCRGQHHHHASSGLWKRYQHSLPKICRGLLVGFERSRNQLPFPARLGTSLTWLRRIPLHGRRATQEPEQPPPAQPLRAPQGLLRSPLWGFASFFCWPCRVLAGTGGGSQGRRAFMTKVHYDAALEFARSHKPRCHDYDQQVQCAGGTALELN